MPVVREADGTVTVAPRADLLRRQPPTDVGVEALNKLHIDLAVATELAESLGDHGRQGVFRSMVALLDYCAGQGIPRASLYPLHLIAGALVDADRGVSTPAFEPTKLPGRPKVSLEEATPRALQAVVVECCIRQKKLDGAKAYKVEGAKLAAEYLRRAGWKPALTARQLMLLREEVSSREAGDPMRTTFDEMVAGPAANLCPLDFAKLLLRHGWVNSVPAGPQS